MLHRPGRFDRLREIRELDPVRDCHQIYRTTALWEFPFDVRMGLLLAFWRTFAVPSIAELLAATGETTTRTERRADDTGILMYTLIEYGLDHPLGRAATRRLNQLHRRYAIDNDDYLYVLGTFVFVGTRWIDRYGWRALCCHERAAIYHFYAELGRRLRITGIPPDLESYAHWYDAFEAERFAASPAARQLITATKRLLADLPKPLVPVGERVADALLDPPLRAAVGVTPPPWWARALLSGGLAGRAGYLRHGAAPRRQQYLDGGLRAKTYPDGYNVATVGPAEQHRVDGAARAESSE
ncbi:oxygenase MpaB family protein [Plantactinospora mayteni]|uniref:Peptidase n=1 Tax=Plantactinospora mayteni TaxID=566021 RepID=A0ABQ4EV65_9ACTN|nr:oxygenase MpaB family protein [Plantactinospora mayteni]GIG98570.1 peptidase [Plantactinospora mayteni]